MMFANANSHVWSTQETQHETMWCETRIANVDVWLEWNARVYAYRFGFKPDAGPASGSHLGYCDSLLEAQGLALDAVQAWIIGNG